MANYANLLATIAANIYTNGNNEVTAAMVKSACDAMVASLGAGYQFMGIATPTSPGTAQAPDQKVFYVAYAPGTYTYLGGIVVNSGEIAILAYSSSWEKITIFPKFNATANARWYSSGIGTVPYLVNGENKYIASIILHFPVNSGDTIEWCYKQSGTPDNTLFLNFLNDNNEVVERYTSNNSSGKRSFAVNLSATRLDVSGVMPTDNFSPYLKINGNIVWYPTLGWEYEVTEQLQSIRDTISSTIGGLQRVASIMIPSGGSMFNYNRKTGVFSIPANTAIKWQNNGVDILGTATTITLTHNYGVITYNTNTKQFADRYDGNLQSGYEYVVFGYNKTLIAYFGELITSLPVGSVQYDDPEALTSINFEDIYPVVRGVKYAYPDNTSTPLQLLWFSDIHANADRLAAIAHYYNLITSYIDDVIATGDQNEQYFDDDFAWWAANGGTNFLQVIGNHEAWKGGQTYASEGDVYTKFFSPYISGWGVVSGGAGHNYYYKDYPSSKVRLIVLDCMFWDATQNSWLISTLASAKTAGLSVIIAQHYLAGTPSPISCNYTAINVEQEGTINSQAPDAVKDFINGGGSFICWIGGHYHADYIYELENFPGQYGILIGTAARNQMEKNNFRGIPQFYNLFSALQVDLTYHQVKLVRIGANIDRWNRHKELVCFDYTTGEVIVY